MYCSKCGKDVGQSNFCPECGQPVQSESANQNMPVRTSKKPRQIISGKIAVVIVVICFILGIIIIPGIKPKEKTGYSSVDRLQATDEHYEEVADYMDGYMEEQGYYVIEYSVKWIGYNNYADLYTEEEYAELETGGYYSYSGKLSTGEVLDGRVRTYWEEGEDPEIVNLNILTQTSNIPIVEYSEEEITECWNIYYNKCFPSA